MDQQPRERAPSTSTDSIAAALRPVVIALLRAGVGTFEATDLLKWLFVHECASLLARDGHRLSVSRIAAATGLSRAETAELLAAPRIEPKPFGLRPQRCARVLSGWMSDSDFLEADGSPRELAFSAEPKSFQDLVRRYSGDIPPRAMLDELLNRNWVTESAQGLLAPVRSFSPIDSLANPTLEELGWKLGALGSTLAINPQRNATNRLFEGLVQSDRIDARSRGKVLRELNRRCRVFSQGIERFLLDQELLIHDNTTVNTSPAQLGLILAVIEDTPRRSIAEREGPTND